MTSYFDNLRTEINRTSDAAISDAEFLSDLMGIERQVIRDVSLNTGDREFPDDLREAMLKAIACEATVGALSDEFYTKAREMAVACRSSQLCETLHSLFHRLAGRRVMARFGLWSDSPAGNMKRRDEHDSPPLEESSK